MGRRPVMSYEEYLRCARGLDQNPLLDLTPSEWNSVQGYAYATLRNPNRMMYHKDIAARAIICERFQASLRQVIAAYPEFYNIRDVIEWTTHPTFSSFAQMFMGHHRQCKKIPAYFHEHLTVLGTSSGLNCKGLVPLKDVEKIF